MSDTDLVDSTSPRAPPAWSDAPSSGSWTNTTSPRASWAKSVMPTRTLPSSMRAHSWSLVYRRSSGTFTGLGSYRMGGPQRRGPGEGRKGRVGEALDGDVHAPGGVQRLDCPSAYLEPGLERRRFADGDDTVRRGQGRAVGGDRAGLWREGARRADALAVDGEGFGTGVAQFLDEVDQGVVPEAPFRIVDVDGDARPVHGNRARQHLELDQLILGALGGGV